MSASPIARQACSHAQAIPSRKVLITDPSQMPDVYSSTPGGTLFSTTPGGTRIVYERAFLMNLKNSPLSRTPPNNVPLGLLKGQPNIPINRKTPPKSNLATMSSPPKHQNHLNNNSSNNDDQFDMDM
ncbi:eukaryotic translation initiation factor 4E-binding protein [Culicoides brevitarsis]|uniref:eukaryotic translation initiation factor 4E-binding protein n=1 Tax=Culicoides brevitarsis TaxID=469753 RepID=UPI00307C34FC